MTAIRDLLARYVERHNAGIRDGDFAPMLELFDEDAVMHFVDLRSGLLAGRTAIGKAFADNGPNDELTVLRIADESDDQVVVDFGWSSEPDSRSGWFLMRLTDRGSIGRIVVLFG